METVKIPCTNCNGKGTIRAYASVKNGICFSCNGSGYHEIKMNEEELKQYKSKKQIHSLESKLIRIEKEGKQLKSKIEKDQNDFNNRLNNSQNKLGRELNENELSFLNDMYQFDKLNEQINELRNEYKQTKELIKMLRA